MIKKNTVYMIDKKKMVCILSDKEFGCLCPISAHKKDNGYSIKLSHPVIYSVWDKMREIGKVSNGVLTIKK